MKKYIVAVMLVLLLPAVSYAKCCDCCKDNYLWPGLLSLTGTTTKFINSTGIEKLIGKMVHRTVPIDTGHGKDDSFMGSQRKLLAITDKYLFLTSDTSYNGLHELERDTWDDGNWEEVVKKLLTVAEITVGGFPLTLGIADKYCVRCGSKLHRMLAYNYYCGSCKTGFNIKEE